MTLTFWTKSGSCYEVREGEHGPELRRTGGDAYVGRARAEWRPLECVDVQVGKGAVLSWGGGGDEHSPYPEMPEGNERLTVTSPVVRLLVATNGQVEGEADGCRWAAS